MDVASQQISKFMWIYVIHLIKCLWEVIHSQHVYLIKICCRVSLNIAINMVVVLQSKYSLKASDWWVCGWGLSNWRTDIKHAIILFVIIVTNTPKQFITWDLKDEFLPCEASALLLQVYLNKRIVEGAPPTLAIWSDTHTIFIVSPAPHSPFRALYHTFTATSSPSNTASVPIYLLLWEAPVRDSVRAAALSVLRAIAGHRQILEEWRASIKSIDT
jgi:hypothetical protein